jgi:hypothetical protein
MPVATEEKRIKVRRGTDAEWTSANPILLEGEIGYSTDGNYFKIGDGATAWSSITATFSPLSIGSLVDLVYPVGCYYTQYPAAASNTESLEFPTSEEPGTLFPGTTWTAQFDTESVFFRTQGTDSDDSRTDGLQDSANKSHDHGGDTSTDGAHTHGIRTEGGATSGTTYSEGAASTYDFTVNTLSAGNHSHTITADGETEARPKNRRIKVWKRTA